MIFHLRRALCEPAIACRCVPGAGHCARPLRRVNSAACVPPGVSTALPARLHARRPRRSLFLSLLPADTIMLRAAVTVGAKGRVAQKCRGQSVERPQRGQEHILRRRARAGAVPFFLLFNFSYIFTVFSPFDFSYIIRRRARAGLCKNVGDGVQ